MQDPYTLQRPSDTLVRLRQFVGDVNAALNDQSYAGQDGLAANRPGQFAVVGPYGASIEGQPVALTSAGGLQLSPAVVLIGLGVLVALVARKVL